jgi:ABC-type antimicrobial peptide transport system permease subunit
MRFTDYLALAFRSLRRSRLRTGLTVAAIVVGATGLTVMLTFVTSVKSYVTDQFVQSGQNLQVQVSQSANLKYDPTGQSGGGRGPTTVPAPGPAGTSSVGSGSAPALLTPALEASITALPHVTGAAGTFSVGNQSIQYVSSGTQQAATNNLVGEEPNGVIKPTLVAGRTFRSTDTANAVVVTQDYADALGFKNHYAKFVGQSIDLHTMTGYTGVGATLPNVLPPQNPCGQQQRSCFGGPTSGLPSMVLSARVVGVVTSSKQQGTLYLPLSWMIGLFNQATPNGVQYPQQQPGPNGQSQNAQPGQQNQQGPGVVTGGWSREDPAQFITDNGGYRSFLVNVDTTDHIATVAASINRLGVNTATGLAALQDQQDKANVIGAVLGGLGLVALGIAALGVMNTMVMSVLERTREIGVMRAVGARRSAIRRLFTFEAAALGFLGGVIGVLIGEAFVLAAKSVISHAVTSGPISGANFSVPLWLIFVVIGVTTLIGLASGFLPARRAARLDPVEALRYE